MEWKSMNYKNLKLGKYGIPSWDGFIPVVLKVANDGNDWKSKDLRAEVLAQIKLPDKLENLSYPKYPDDKVADNRIAWAISDLYIAGLLARPKRGIYKITDRGRQLLDNLGLKLTQKDVHAEPAYIEHVEELKKRNTSEPTDMPEEIDIPREIANQVTDFNNTIATDLHKRILESDPAFFESLVTKLLEVMNYKGSNGTVKITPLTNDGGIDGIINQDPLGTQTVYIQAKRYANTNVVQRPAIQAFFGALSQIHADRGVFITTSSFSAGAIEAAKSFSIVLIDGIKLTDLMLQYHVGVQVKQNFQIFEVDEDFFDPDTL
jgi:restriction system protein